MYVCVCVCVCTFLFLFSSLSLLLKSGFTLQAVLYFILCYCSAFLSFYSHTLHYIAGVTENIKFQRILIRVRDPRGLYLNPKTWLYLTAYTLYYWKPQAKQLVRQEHGPTHQNKQQKMKEQGKKYTAK